MKRYKLTKDLPTFRVGQLAYISKTGNLIAGTPENPETNGRGGIQLMMYNRTTLEKFPEILTEWFEEIQEPTDSIHWEPRIGERCWSFLADGEAVPFYWSTLPYDLARHELGNIYRTEKECEKARDRRLAEVRLRRTSTFKPDFENRNGGWIVVYNYVYHKLFAENIRFEDAGEPVRYETEEEAERSIKENEQDWMIYFGIEEED